MSNLPDAPSGVILPPASPLYQTLCELRQQARLVFFAGLPGTGKSLLIHQLAHLAHALGRKIDLLQWDVARPAFEASPDGRRYPQAQGVTHGIIRLAVGRWARAAVARWYAGQPGTEHLLIGETPFVGNRLIELARVADDEAESVLNAASTRFIVPVPSRAVRQHLEAERERRAQNPLHARETEDAPPHVLRDLWRQLVSVARTLDLATTSADDAPYDPRLYEAVYMRILRHRHAQPLALDVILPTTQTSAYHFVVPTRDLLPSDDEVRDCIRATEEAYADPAKLQQAIAQW